jgi:predicted nucleic acid-binding protein
VKLFIDTNVVLDVLMQREPWARSSTRVLALLADNMHEGFVGAHTFSTLHYMMRKASGAPRTVTALLDLIKLVRVAPLDHELVVQALALPWKDFEDALHTVCAINIDADVLVTRNPRDFLASPIRVMDPDELLSHLQALATGLT